MDSTICVYAHITNQESSLYFMKTESYIRILAGTLVLVSVTLGHFVSAWWLLLAVFVGLNLIQSAVTRFCPAELIVVKLGLGTGPCHVGFKREP